MKKVLSDCNKCVWGTRDGGCASWDCEFIDRDEAVKAWRQLSSADPEPKEIGYVYCSSALLKMWIDNVLTDGEYNRIMDKLNAMKGKGNERCDLQTGGD